MKTKRNSKLVRIPNDVILTLDRKKGKDTYGDFLRKLTKQEIKI